MTRLPSNSKDTVRRRLSVSGHVDGPNGPPTTARISHTPPQFLGEFYSAPIPQFLQVPFTLSRGCQFPCAMYTATQRAGLARPLRHRPIERPLHEHAA